MLTSLPPAHYCITRYSVPNNHHLSRRSGRCDGDGQPSARWKAIQVSFLPLLRIPFENWNYAFLHKRHIWRKGSLWAQDCLGVLLKGRSGRETVECIRIVGGGGNLRADPSISMLLGSPLHCTSFTYPYPPFRWDDIRSRPSFLILIPIFTLIFPSPSPSGSSSSLPRSVLAHRPFVHNPKPSKNGGLVHHGLLPTFDIHLPDRGT